MLLTGNMETVGPMVFECIAESELTLNFAQILLL